MGRNGNNANHGEDSSHLSHSSHPKTFEDYREFVETRSPEVIANIAICLIHQTNYLIDQQLRRLEQDCLKEGGLRERIARARLQARNGRG